MRAALRTWTGGVAAFVVAILAAACSSSTHLPTGVFSGSNAADLPVVIDIGSNYGAKQHLFNRATKATTFAAPYVMSYEDNMPMFSLYCSEW